MSYNVNWFKENMQAIPCGGVGACSFCCLRNLDKGKFCYKLHCCDAGTGDTVYWTTKNPEISREILMGHPPLDMIEWFNNVPIKYAKDISVGILRRAFDNSNQK